MSTSPLVHELHSIDVPLEQIFLDPNNPRFVNSAWIPIADAEIDKADVQEAAQRRLVKNFEVEKLRMNMEVNGYLPIDRVILREFAPGKFVVLEGNRRICAAKMITSIGLDGSTIDDSVSTSLKQIPCLQYSGQDKEAAWIFQGLRHIVGVVEWSAFNKAKLLVDQMESEDLNLTAVGRRFGLTAHGAGQWVRGYHSFRSAQENSDYINEVDERSYPFFQELFGRTSAPVREWLEWDDKEYKFNNLLNFNEFIGWLYPKSGDGAETNVTKGDWEKRRLVRRDDIRLLAYLITESPDHFIQFRNGLDLEKCYSSALARKYEEDARKKADVVADVFDAITKCTKAIVDLPFRMLKDVQTKTSLLSSLSKLEAAINDIKS
jgi:hypothetical protein